VFVKDSVCVCVGNFDKSIIVQPFLVFLLDSIRILSTKI
jgi:hypothetical protein